MLEHSVCSVFDEFLGDGNFDIPFQIPSLHLIEVSNCTLHDKHPCIDILERISH